MKHPVFPFDWERISQKAIEKFRHEATGVRDREIHVRDCFTRPGNWGFCVFCLHRWPEGTTFPHIKVSTPADEDRYVADTYRACPDQDACDDRIAARAFKEAVK